MGKPGLFTVVLLTISTSLTLLKSSHASCLDKPIFEDLCYEGQSVALDWKQPQSCSDVNNYEVVYTKAPCSIPNASVERVNVTNETIFVASYSDVYCVRVRAVIGENCYSRNSTCVQVASFEKDQIFNVTIHGELCIAVNLCQQHHTSRIILCNAWECNHQIWHDLEMRHNVNRTYNNRTDTFHFCFNNVTESFLFLEYCDVSRVQPCESGSTFCCSNWATFVSKTRVNVAGDRYGGCSDSLLDIMQFVLTPQNSEEITTPATAFITRSGTSSYTSVISRSAPGATPNTPPDGDLRVLGVLSLVPIILSILVVTLIIYCCWYLKKKSNKKATAGSNSSNNTPSWTSTN